uniref:Reverse transcriptase domain-containing protein n=1 Tax=Beta vulgaris subsp. vulgaris TaxID=3555 RepID=F4NCJ8_BETVV|nr:hypothetical protein [Beta vulgaris subsp. vulgaris]
MSVISWNVRGLGSRAKRSSLRKHITKHEPTFVFIQETKMEEMPEKIMRSIWKSDNVEWIISPSQGNSGGILSIWNTSFFAKKSSIIKRHWIAIKGSLVSHNFDCILINVYNSCLASIRAEVWTEIRDFWKECALPSLIIGDFNEVLNSSERRSLIASQSEMTKFRDFVQNLQLLEIPSSSGGFTWFRGNSKSLLDRLFINPEWLILFPGLKLSLLMRGLSDHCPLLVHNEDKNWGPKPFRFQNCWLSDPNCLKIVKEVWQASSGVSAVGKLKAVRKRLKVWNQEEYGNIDNRISKMENLIQQYDEISNQRILTEDELEEKQKAQVELWKWMKRREVYWAQNARISWLKEGDRNTRFFHTIASNKRRKNSIICIEVKGKESGDPQIIKREAVSHFKKIFAENNYNRPTFKGLSFRQITDDQASDLTQPFSNKEIDEAVSSCAADKAPGPDGFNFRFIKSAWETVKSDIYAMVRKFHDSSTLPQGCNIAYITLIQKIDNPKNFNDYRPISMVGCIYKIIAKLLARRLQGVINSLIGPLQFSYIEGRSILDGALIASELIDHCKRKSIEAALLKLDFHKAYDSISWSFLEWVLKEMNFPDQWCKWIMNCVSTAAVSILVNGSPCAPFKLQRGLRQGDPLSSFLFVLIAESLNQIIMKATSQNLWKGVEVGQGEIIVTHLQYADDTLIFCDANIESLKNVKKALILFQLASGLQINFHKSSLIGLNTSSGWIKVAAEALLCKIGEIPFTYLGVPIGGQCSRIQLWDPIIAKISRRLATWKCKMLSIGGRLTLIKSSLISLPVYFMSIYPMPQDVVNKIIGLARQFLWAGSDGKNAMPLVAWSVLQLPKSLGGMGIGNIKHKNQALLFKWIWRLFDEPSQLWCKIIRAKYKYPNTLTISDIKIPNAGGPWRSICASYLRNQDVKDMAIKGVRKNVKNGHDSLFWHDVWIGEATLKSLFPRLFTIAMSPNGSVASYGFWDGLAWVWSFSWRRMLRPQDLIEKTHLDSLLQQAHVAYEKKDQLIWAYSSSGKFSTKSFSLEVDKLSPPPHHDAINGVWRGLVPHRIEIFVWMALLGKISTKHKLAKIGIIPKDDDICILCSNSSETSDHLLLHCNFARSLWHWWFSLWNIQWVFPHTLREAFDQWQTRSRCVFFKKAWLTIFFIIVWSVWKERNSRIFEKSESSVKDIQDLILLRLGWWIKGWCDEFPYSPNDVLRSPSCLIWNGANSLMQYPKLQPCPIVWTPPIENFLKWNVDASANPLLSTSAMGGVLRNSQGNFMCLFSSPIPFMEINCAEILGIYRAVKISISSDCIKEKNLIIESDSANAVSWCNQDEGGPWNMNFQLNFIRNARKKNLRLTITHERRSANFVADSMAKQGIHRQSEFIAWM